MNKALKIFAFVLIALAVVIGCAVVYFSYQNSVVESEEEIIEIQEIPAIVDKVDEVVEEEIYEEDVVEDEVEEEEIMVDAAECATFEERVDDTAGKIEVDWIKEWATTSPEIIFDDEILKRIDQCFYRDDYYYGKLVLGITSKILYKKGTIISGPYKGNDIYQVELNMDSMMMTDHYRIIKNGENYIYLSEYSDPLLPSLKKYFITNSLITIPDLDLPEKVKIPNVNNYLLLGQSFNRRYTSSEFLFSFGAFSFKKYSKCLFAELKDGTLAKYEFDIDSLGTTNIDLDLVGFNKEDEYDSNLKGGCGGSFGCYDYVDDFLDDTVEEVGKSPEGLSYYTKEEDLHSLYESYYPGYKQEKDSYEDFVKGYPVIYMKDPFGYFIRFTKTKYMPVAECAKPVIYLYPEQEQDISVWVEPNGGFTVTEPVYDNGWRVRADTESNIYNYADGEVYPYLFWEGHAYNYQMGDKGFVVAREDVREFLVDSLTKLGLIQKEYDEFIEFWLPKMQEKNYYFISFMPQAEFEQLAPLTVSPKPDTVIRVFMDYQGLDNAISVAPQELSAPARNGFTVVEWGGALHR